LVASLRNTLAYINPEIAEERVLVGVAGHWRISPMGKSRASLPQTTEADLGSRVPATAGFGFGPERNRFRVKKTSSLVHGPDSLYRRRRPLHVTDFSTTIAISHDPRTQFMAWGVMYNGAWDYPADTRGYTWGWMHELHLENWSLAICRRG